MAALRMHFIEDSGGWDYGYLTLQIWLKTFKTWAFRDNYKAVLEFWIKYDMAGLGKHFQQGEVLFTIEQTIFFFRQPHVYQSILFRGRTNYLNLFLIWSKRKQAVLRRRRNLKIFTLNGLPIPSML